MHLVPINCQKVVQGKTYTLFVMKGGTKTFGIYAEPHMGLQIQPHIDKPKQGLFRPKTHDLITSIFEGLDVHPLQVVLYDVIDHVYFAKLFLKQQKTDKMVIIEADARPSDCMVFALVNNLPLFAYESLLEKVDTITE